MINSVNVSEQTVLANQNILFNVDRVRTKSCGCNGWLHHDLGSGQFTLTKCGIYEIQFNANVTSATPGALVFNIENNGENIGGTEMDTTVVTAGTYANISASTLVQVPCGSSTTITIGNNSLISTLVKDANIIIKRNA